MKFDLKKALLAAILAGLGYYGYRCYCSDRPDCGPAPVNPTPDTKPAPKPRPGPWGPRPCPKQEAAGSAAKPQEGGRVSPDGTEEIQIDLPESERKRNVGGRDGAGLCVFTSIEYAGRWQHERELFTFQENMRKELGGGYPEKVDKMMGKYAPHVAYAQSTAKDRELLKAILASGRMACVTYDGHDCHYSGSIAHMVCLAHFSDKWAAVSDNNFIRENQFVWMSPDEFLHRWSGWVVWLMAPPPPPVPHVAGAEGGCSCVGCPRGGFCFPRCQCHKGIGGPVYEWRAFPDDPTQVSLWLAGRQVGTYSYSWRVYRPLAENGQWGDPCDPPTLPPGVEPPTGVDAARVQSYGHAYTVQGREVSREELFRIIEDGKVPDDARLPYLTLIGAKEKTDRVLADLKSPALAGLAGRFKVNVFAPDEWQVKEGFAYGGDLTIYLSAPDGRVLSRSDSYPGAPALARAMNGALRKADPRYDPKKDPDLSRPFSLPFDPAKVPTPVWLGGAAVLVMLLLRKDK